MWEAIKTFFMTIGQALAPVVYGLVFAFLLSPLYNKLSKKLPKWISEFICLLVLLVAFAIIGLLLVPQVVDSVAELVKQAPDMIKSLDDFTQKALSNNPEIATTVNKYYSGLGDSINRWVETSFIPNISSYFSIFSSGVMTVVVALKNVIIGVIIMLYFLAIKDMAKARAIKITYSLLPLENANTFIDDCRFTYNVFNDFLVGKIIDSAIIGVLTFITTSLLKIPYAAFISIVVGITNIIPFFGPIIGAIPCALLIFVVSPTKCLVFIVLIIIIQQIDGNIIGPKILGQKVGVSSFWILVSILLFGGMFGFVGMVIAVPVFAVIYRLINRVVVKKLKAKELSADTKDYMGLEKIDEETKEYIKKDGTDTTGEMER